MGFPGPLRHNSTDDLGLFGRDPALHMHQALLSQALAVAALFVGVAGGHELPYSE
ncbi:MAG TPA: hypothetical protein PLD53_01565 [Candidatus Propionivibrio aalborgensis]|nr:hypothetical protein [Candidatus Propionivibrio aalborgensis]